MVTFVRIVNPQAPGEFLVLAAHDFDGTVHARFDDARPMTLAELSAAAVTPTAAGDGAGTGAGGPVADVVLTDLNAADAKAAIAAADLATLDRFEASEQAHPTFAGGRKSVIDALAARRKALTAPE